MKEHEDEVMPSVEKFTVTIDSIVVDEIVTERLGGGEAKSEGFLTEKDKGEDMMVDVVGSDAVEGDHECTGVNLDSNAASEELVEECIMKETETHDQDMEEVADSGEDCDVSIGIRVLTCEKAEVVANEEEVAGSGEDYNASVETRVSTSEKVEVILNEEGLNRSAAVSKDILQGNVVVTTVASGSNGDIAVISSKELAERSLMKEVVELHVESVEEVTDGKIAESSFTTVNLGSEEVDAVVVEEDFHSKDKAEDSVSVDPTLVCANNQSIATEVVNAGTGEDNLHPTIKFITDDSQEMTDGDRVVNDKIEVLNFLKISEPSSSMNPRSEDADVAEVEEVLASKDDKSLSTEVVNSATGEGEINVYAENLDQQPEVDKLIEKETAIEVITETSVGVNKETEGGLTPKNEEIVEHLTEPVQEVAYGNVVMDEKAGKGDEVVGSPKIPESLTTVILGPEEVNGVAPVVKNPEFSYEDAADMEGGEDAGMDIDEVLGWNDEVDVISGAEKGQRFNITTNSEADVEQKLPESSSKPVQIQHREENIKSREPIVYGRRVHVEVPLYESLDVEQKLPESSSPASEDENLKIETDSEEEEEEDEEDDDDESVQEDEQKAVKQTPELLENENLFSLHQSRYFQPPKNEGEFSISDLVWGKVRSHPWWPGQIIDPSNTSKKAMKYYKKDRFLVAYFGDHTFAWNNSSVLKPFRANFSQIEKQTDTEMFKIAVECALEEVTRRVQLGLACSCILKHIYKKIEYQVIENGGVRKKSNKRHGKDESASVSSFEPDKLVDYVRLLAQFPGQGDKMDLAMAKAQLSSFGHYKGYRELHEFRFIPNMLEDAPEQETVGQVLNNGEKFENNLIESAHPYKEIILSDTTDDAPESVGGTSKSVSSSGSKKRKARVSISNGSVKRPNRPPNNVSAAQNLTPKPSFKVGELIQRVASQLTGPPPKVDHGQHVDQLVGSSVSLQTPEKFQKEASVAEMLSQLHLTAQDPMKGYSFLQTIIPFFYERRAAVFSKSLKKHLPIIEIPDRSRERKESTENDPEEFEFEFEFDDVNDSYWTDRIIQNHSEDQPLQDNQNGGVEEYQVVEYKPDKPGKRKRRSNKKRVFSSNNREVEVEVEVKEESEVVKKRRENLATEVVLKFEEGINLPSEIQLNKMFRRFGPLMESETEVDRQGGRARVVFKKCCDAEVAHSSAGKFNIFGSVNVHYELNYNPLVSYKPLPLPLLQDPMDAS